MKIQQIKKRRWIDRSIDTGVWLIGSVAFAALAFVPVPRPWPPRDATTLLPPPVDYPLILALFLGIIGFLLVRPSFVRCDRNEPARLRWSMIFLVVQVILLRAVIEARPLIAAEISFPVPLPILVFPWGVAVALVTMLFGVRYGFFIAAATAALAGIIPDSGADPVRGIGVAIAGFVVVWSVKRCPTRWHVIRGCIRAGLVFGTIALLATAIGTRDPGQLGMAFGEPFVVGLLSGLVLLLVLPVAEWVTRSLSEITLIEYASDHKLLDLLRDEAPGTWNHTINVADLAETAARAIGANSLFCRTAVLYHDIGKVKEPLAFAENQRGASLHDDLTPRKSAEKIIGHVTHGLELARKHRLPAPLRAIIAEHHGTSLVRFFYARAIVDVEDPEERRALEAKFRYPGPPPSSRESGIIALADTVEAATRSAADLDEDGIGNLVFKLIADRIQEGELNSCSLTLAELALVRESFVATVVSRHHTRPKYPDPADAAPAPKKLRSRFRRK